LSGGGRSAASRNLIGAASLAAFLVLLLGPWSPLRGGHGGDGWAWFRAHPGVLGALVVGVCVLVVVTLLTQRAGAALLAALVVGAALYAVPDLRSTLGKTERPFLADKAASAPAKGGHR
jgi:peptidoglycan/LPS O-acetylase OafA/YrhL